MRTDCDLTLFANPSEETAFRQVEALFARVLPGSRVLSNVYVPAASKSPHSGPVTTEYDIIVVSPIGVIVFEVKGWAGAKLFREYVPATGRSRWMLRFDSFSNGRRLSFYEERRNALKQCISKVNLLRKSLNCWVSHFVLFTHDQLEIEAGMSDFLLHLCDLDDVPGRVAKLRQSHGDLDKPLDARMVNAIADSLLEIGNDISPEIHQRNVQDYLDVLASRKRGHRSRTASCQQSAPGLLEHPF